MRVFVTGASGYIGYAVAKAFRRHGHDVAGMVRNKGKARMLEAVEIKPVIGDLEKPDSYRDILDTCEVFVHCALEPSPRGQELDARTINTFFHQTKTLNLPRVFLYTAGAWVWGNTTGTLIDEGYPMHPIEFVRWRREHIEMILQNRDPFTRTIVICPGVVYGGSKGLTAQWFHDTLSGEIQIVGSGENHWAMVHVKDLAQAYVLAAEKELDRVILNIVDHSRNTVKEMTEALTHITPRACHVRSLSAQEAFDRFGPLAEGLKIDQTISNDRAFRLLDWKPRHPTFLEDLTRYYNAWHCHVEHKHHG
ncbi:MAG: NAD-dependent epimerase/dehydratase family protein [Chlamydiia bacterium]|nr:NAD-dependent epimerase/dehydratase family protein [Chlamydiia bacterium]